MKNNQMTSEENTITVNKSQESLSEIPSKNIEERSLVSTQNKNSKNIKIRRKHDSVLKKLSVEAPLCFNHVYNVLNMLGLNEWSLKDKNYEQSYFKSMFYIRSVEKVQVRKHAVIVQLKSMQTDPTSLQYLINRFKSFGDNDFYQLACKIETIAVKFNEKTFHQKLMKSFDSEPLSRFIDSMQEEIYMCKVAPNKLVISRRLLQLLGEDPQVYAIELCKYKMPLREIISTQCYSSVINKSVENIGLICDYLNDNMTFDQLYLKTSLQFDDFLYTRQHKKIYCKLNMYMPTPLTACIHVKSLDIESDDLKNICSNYRKNKTLIDLECQQQRYKEAETLKNIIKMPDCLLMDNKKKLAGYRVLQGVQQLAF